MPARYHATIKLIGAQELARSHAAGGLLVKKHAQNETPLLPMKSGLY
jgi:hypothetical protein